MNDIIYVTQAQFDTLVAGGSITVGGVTYTYDEHSIYVVQDGLPPVPTTDGDYKLHVVDGVATWVSV